MLWYECYTSIELLKENTQRKGFILVLTKESVCLLRAFRCPERRVQMASLGEGVSTPAPASPHHTPFF